MCSAELVYINLQDHCEDLVQLCTVGIRHTVLCSLYAAVRAWLSRRWLEEARKERKSKSLNIL